MLCGGDSELGFAIRSKLSCSDRLAQHDYFFQRMQRKGWSSIMLGWTPVRRSAW
jgi:hypothetical protein